MIQYTGIVERKNFDNYSQMGAALGFGNGLDFRTPSSIPKKRKIFSYFSRCLLSTILDWSAILRCLTIAILFRSDRRRPDSLKQISVI